MVSEMESVLKQVSGVECSSIASGIKNNGELDLSLILSVSYTHLTLPTKRIV